MKHTLTMYHKLLGVQLRSQMQYRVSFWLDLTGTAVITLFEFAALALVFERFGDLGGWTLAQVAFLYGIVNFAFAFSNIIFSGFNPSQFGQEVRMGTFDRIMLRPINITAQVLGSRLEIRRLGKLALAAGPRPELLLPCQRCCGAPGMHLVKIPSESRALNLWNIRKSARSDVTLAAPKDDLERYGRPKPCIDFRAEKF